MLGYRGTMRLLKGLGGGPTQTDDASNVYAQQGVLTIWKYNLAKREIYMNSIKRKYINEIPRQDSIPKSVKGLREIANTFIENAMRNQYGTTNPETINHIWRTYMPEITNAILEIKRAALNNEKNIVRNGQSAVTIYDNIGGIIILSEDIHVRRSVYGHL